MSKHARIFVFGIIFMLFTFSMLAGLASAKTFKWKLFLYYPPQVAMDYKGWCDEIKALTNGNLDIRVFYDGEHPFKAADLLSALKDRSCDMANVHSSYTGGVEPMLFAVELPFMMRDTKSHAYVVTKIRDSSYDPILQEKWNQKLLLWSYYPGQSLQTKDVFLESFDSLKTKKIRIFNKDTANWAMGLNATPVTIPWAEVYTAAQRGVIDGATGSLGTVYDSKWYEILKYITVMDSWLSIDGINVNLDAWKELPEEYQKIVMETAAKWQKSFWLKRETDNFKKNVFAQQNYGCKVTHLNPEFRKEIMKMCEEKIWPSWVERTGQPDKAREVLKDIVKHRTEFEKMPKDKQSQWLIEHGFPEQVLDF